MITIIFALFLGWLLHFIGLNDLFHNLVGWNDHQYYCLWLFVGVVIWLEELFRRKA